MRETARAYPVLVRAGLARAFEYRVQIVLGILLAFVPLVMLAAWLAVVDEGGPAAGWQRADFIAYYVAVTMVFQFTSSYAAWEWQREIRTGDLSTRLLKPLDPFHYYLSQQIGSKIFAALLFVPLVFVASWAIPELRYPLAPGRLAAFALSVLSAFVLNALISSTFGLIGFWSTQSGNLYGVVFGIGQFLSGWLAPLALFPGALAQAAALLPFHCTLGFPVEILIGRLDGPGIAANFAITAAWLLLFLLLYRVLWRRGLARYEAVGN